MFPKPERAINEELLDEVRSCPCVACEPGHQEYKTQAHHVTTKGAGGGDTEINVMPLCVVHHRCWHQNPSKFIREHKSVHYWLSLTGREDVLTRFGF